MTHERRIGIGLLGLAMVAWQFYWGAMTTIGLAAPGVGPEAAWVPQALMFESFTLVPLGFALCVWGSIWGLRVAVACAVLSAALAIVASALLAGAGGWELAPFLMVPAFALSVTAYVNLRRAYAA
jgi:hypothetical protein